MTTLLQAIFGVAILAGIALISCWWVTRKRDDDDERWRIDNGRG